MMPTGRCPLPLRLSGGQRSFSAAERSPLLRFLRGSMCARGANFMPARASSGLRRTYFSPCSARYACDAFREPASCRLLLVRTSAADVSWTPFTLLKSSPPTGRRVLVTTLHAQLPPRPSSFSSPSFPFPFSLCPSGQAVLRSHASTKASGGEPIRQAPCAEDAHSSGDPPVSPSSLSAPSSRLSASLSLPAASFSSSSPRSCPASCSSSPPGALTFLSPSLPRLFGRYSRSRGGGSHRKHEEAAGAGDRVFSSSSIFTLIIGSLLLTDLLQNDLYGHRQLLGAFLLANAAVFTAWRFAASSGSAFWESVLVRNFLLCRGNLSQRRFFTFFTSCLSHRSASHLVFNLFVINQLFRLLAFDMTDSDFVALFGLASLCGGGGHLLASTRPVLGASAFAYALLWTEATRHSREMFRILPIPFFPVTALQLVQAALCIETAMAFLSRPAMLARFPSSRFLRFAQGISWTGHLGGLAAGCLYSWYKRHSAGDRSWPGFVELNRKFGASDWAFTRQDLKASTTIFLLECKVLFVSSDLERTVIIRQLDRLRMQKELRRQAVALGGIFL